MRRDRISRSRIRAQRCRARSSRTGNPCKRWAIRGGTVCLTHGGSAPQVKHAAEQRLADLIDKDRALRELARLAYSDISQFYDDQQRLRPMSDWTPTMKAVVASLKTTVYNRVVGDGKPEKALELRMWDKVRNLENLLTHLGLLKDRVELSGDQETLRLLARLDEGRKRNAER